MPVIGIDGGRVDFDQYLVILGRRFFHFFKFKNVG
jgi:hypothetical protein